ncbi:hypothetical protein D9M73_194460 [compost metagenome]
MIKQGLAGQHFRGVDVTAGRYGKVAAVEQHQAQDVVADFRLAIGAVATGCLFAGRLRVRAVIKGPKAGCEPHIPRKRVDILLIEVRLSGFPAKSSQNGLLQSVIPDPVRSPADAFVRLGLCLGVGQDRLLGDRFEQTQANHWRRHTGRETGVGVHRAVTQLGDVQARFA